MMPAKPPRMKLLSMFGRRMRAQWEQLEGAELNELEFVDLLTSGYVSMGLCKGCGDRRKLLHDFVCATCNQRCIRTEGFVS